MAAGNQSLLKKNNQRAIVEYILKNGAISRADLAKMLDVTKPTISSNISALTDNSILLEVGYSRSEVGKKPMLFDFNKDYKYVLALDFLSYRTKNIVLVSVCNLFCDVIFTEKLFLGDNYSAQTVSTIMPIKILEMLNLNDILVSRLGVVVLTAPTSSCNTGIVMFECANHDMINLAKVIANTFSQTIVIKNDINLAAIGEKHFGVAKGVDNIAFIWAGVAVGGGLILNGELYEGFTQNGGEIAMLAVYNEYTGKYESFKDILSLTGIWNYIDHNKEAASNSSISKSLFSSDLKIGLLIDTAAEGDEFCINLAKYMGGKIGIIVANICSVLDLQMVVIGGEYSLFGDIVLDTLKAHIDALPTTNTIITTPKFSNSAMYGAFKVGVDYIVANLID